MTSQAQPKGAGTSDDGTASVTIVAPLQVIKDQDIDFGVIAPNVTASSTVQTYSQEDFSSHCGDELVCILPGNRAIFKVIGEPERYIKVSNPGSIMIYNETGDTMRVDSFSGAGSTNDLNWGGVNTIGSDGFTDINIGAKLHVNPQQMPGTYIGDFTLTFEYE